MLTSVARIQRLPALVRMFNMYHPECIQTQRRRKIGSPMSCSGDAQVSVGLSFKLILILLKIVSYINRVQGFVLSVVFWSFIRSFVDPYSREDKTIFALWYVVQYALPGNLMLLLI